MLGLLVLLLAASAAEPAPHQLQIVRLQIAGDDAATLAAADRRIADDPDAARAEGVVYLRAHLLERLDRLEASTAEFAAALNGPQILEPRSRYRLARGHFAGGRPEIAAGLLATLLSQPISPELARSATDLLVRSLAETGDCRPLARIESWPLRRAEGRRLRLSQVDCDLAAGHTAAAATELERLLREDGEDPTARLAAERLASLPADFTRDSGIALLLGTTFHHHREFDLAIRYLQQGIDGRYGAAGDLTSAEFTHRYALSRSHFWQQHYQVAASGFAALAARTKTAASTSKSLFQKARALELGGDWSAAIAAYREAYNADPGGDFSAAALLSDLRLEWRSGREESALEAYRNLRSRSRWSSEAVRAALFMAASDIVVGRADRAAAWLDHAVARSGARLEAHYWQGRLAELREDSEGAVGHYLECVRADPYHPLGESASRRLRSPQLAAAARTAGERLAASDRAGDLQGARLLLAGEPGGRAASAALRRLLARSSKSSAYLDIRTIAPAAWPLWRSAPGRAEDVLLRLGIWGEAGPVIPRHFPHSDPDLALTGSRLLFLGGDHRRSLSMAEILDQRRPPDLPLDLLPEIYRQLLHPLPWADLIFAQSSSRGVDPFLLAGLIREESRFQAGAISAASARGLGQFVFATATRLAIDAGLGRIVPEDLDDPTVSISLAAVYLEQLGRFSEGLEPMILAAYNAGESQARLWLSYCYSREPEEYFTKVGFRESRGYLRKVLTSRAHYRELYPLPDTRP